MMLIRTQEDGLFRSVGGHYRVFRRARTGEECFLVLPDEGGKDFFAVVTAECPTEEAARAAYRLLSS